MKNLIILLAILISYAGNAQVQNPYSLSWKTDGSIAGYSVVSIGTFFIVNSKVNPLTPTQIADLDVNSINSFDRNTTKNYVPSIDKSSDFAVAGACVLSAGICGLVALDNSDSKQVFWNQATTLAVMCAEVNMVNSLTTNIIKSSVLRTRPYVYNSSVPMDDKTSIHARKSFFSSHTSVTASNSFFMAQVVSDYYPNTWMSYSAWGVAAALPAAIGYMRVKAGRHFPSDVISGYAFGTACGILIPYLHKKAIQNDNSQVSVGVAPQMVSLKVMF